MPTAPTEQDLMPRKESLKSRYESVRARIAQAAERDGRRGDDVVLVAVTKNASIDQIRELLALGHVDLGENREPQLAQHAAQVDEFLARCRETPSAARGGAVPDTVRWHMIGHLQRNKVRRLLPICRLVHSVDSLRLAEELQAVAASRLDHPAEILVQVNVAGERQKYGIAPAAARHLIEQIDTMFNLRVRGLMCMAPLTEDTDEIRKIFTRCRELFDDTRRSGGVHDKFDILSMGMSHDFEIAVECGANVVRVGSAIFGPPRG